MKRLVAAIVTLVVGLTITLTLIEPAGAGSGTLGERVSRLETQVGNLQDNLRFTRSRVKTLEAYAEYLHNYLAVVDLPLGDKLVVWTGAGEP